MNLISCLEEYSQSVHLNIVGPMSVEKKNFEPPVVYVDEGQGLVELVNDQPVLLFYAFNKFPLRP